MALVEHVTGTARCTRCTPLHFHFTRASSPFQTLFMHDVLAGAESLD